MRILFLIDDLNGGGKERRLVQLIKGLNNRSFNDLHLISLSEVNDYPIIHNYHINLYVLKRTVRWDPLFFFKLSKLVKTINPDLIHSWSVMTSFYVSITCKILKIPHISGFIAGGNSYKRFSIKNFAKHISYALVDVVIGNSASGLIAFKAPKYKSRVIYNGFDFDRLNIQIDSFALRKELKITTPYIVTMVARFEKVKDYTTFFQAADSIINQRGDITFLAIGKGDFYSAFEKKLNKKNKSYIKMIGFTANVDSLIKMSDIGVLCTDPTYGLEGISNSLMEFMAFGKPVIATYGGTNELILEGKTGLIVSPKQAPALSSSINLLIDNLSLRNDIGIEAEKSIQLKFSLSKMTDDYINIYTETCLKKLSK